METKIRDLQATMDRKLQAISKRVRLFTLEYTEKHVLPKNLVLTGLRGVGKSTFLLYHAQKSGKRMLYFSVDNPLLFTENLYELGKYVFFLGYDGIVVDEVHYARNWSNCLKALYDDFPDKTIWVSDSSSLILRNGVADLSRRYVFIKMPQMSFREFLYLETGEKYSISQPFENPTFLPVQPTGEVLSLFERYKEYGTRPFYVEGNYEERSLAILEKTMNTDVTYFVPHITDDNLRVMNAVVGTLAQSAIPRIQVRSLCADWSIGADKLYQLLEVMEALGVIQIVRYEKDTKAKSAGAKIFFADACLYSVLRGLVGTKREAFVSRCLLEMGYDVCASRNERDADFVASRRFSSKNITIEVGGAEKKMKHADYVIRDTIDFGSDKIIPLWLLAMAW